MLLIGSAAEGSKTQWSLDQAKGFTSVSGTNATVVYGALSQTPTAATVFLRNAARVASAVGEGSEDSSAFTLTLVAP
jgi:hypothetical protein